MLVSRNVSANALVYLITTHTVYLLLLVMGNGLGLTPKVLEREEGSTCEVWSGLSAYCL